MPKPLTFDDANRWLAKRVNVPTGMTSAQLALAPDFGARVRMHAMFSARVTSTKVLDALRGEVESYVRGETDIASSRARLKTFLSRQGVAPDDVARAETPPPGMDPDEWQARKRISNLASTRRLDLVLRQNAGMAHALGNRQVSMHPAVKRRYPYFRYDARSDARPTHAALDNLVLPKDDPFWHTHTPPWEFGCRCDLEDADLDDVQTHGTARTVVRENPDGTQSGTVATAAGKTINFDAPQSGFVFRVDSAFDKPDWDLIPDGPLKGIVMREWQSAFGDNETATEVG